MTYTWTYDKQDRLYVIKLENGYVIADKTLQKAKDKLNDLIRNSYFAVYSKEEYMRVIKMNERIKKINEIFNT